MNQVFKDEQEFVSITEKGIPGRGNRAKAAPWNVHKIESSSVRLEKEGHGRKQGQNVGLGLSWRGPRLRSVDLI